jgi:hypothetical protein
LPILWAEGPSETAMVVLIVTAISLIGGKLIELGLNAYKGFRAIDTEGDRGRFLKCQAEIEQLRRDRCIEVDRLTKYHANVCAEYEDRLLNKRQQIEYLHQQLESLHSTDQHKMEMITELQTTFARQIEVMNEWGQKNASNTAKAIEKITPALPLIAPFVPPGPSGPSPAPDANALAAVVTPADKVEIVIPPPDPKPEPGK